MVSFAFIPVLLVSLYRPIRYNQVKYVKDLKDSSLDLVVCNGPAGTGKTLFACQEALPHLEHVCKYSKIVITRPTFESEEDLGYLPGDMHDKMTPWLIPILDIFKELKSKEYVNHILDLGLLEILPLSYMRGRTFKNTIVIADEMQNSSPEQMKMLLTRIGEDSKMVVLGDVNQNTQTPNGLKDLITKIRKYYDVETFYYDMNSDGISLVSLNEKDVQRSEIVKKVLDIYK